MNELKKIAPKLSEIKKEQVFNVPDKYFDDFYSRLQFRLESEQQPYKGNPFLRIFKPALGLAASFALVFILVYFPIKMYMPVFLAKSKVTPVHSSYEENDFRNLLENLDENSFFALIHEPFSQQKNTYENFNDDELLNYISSNVSEYEIYLQTEN